MDPPRRISGALQSGKPGNGLPHGDQSIVSKATYASAQLHIEYNVPQMDAIRDGKPNAQVKGNSGVFLTAEGTTVPSCQASTVAAQATRIAAAKRVRRRVFMTSHAAREGLLHRRRKHVLVGAAGVDAVRGQAPVLGKHAHQLLLGGNAYDKSRHCTILGIWVHPALLWFTLFVGANLLRSGVTNWCPMIAVVRQAGVRG